MSMRKTNEMGKPFHSCVVNSSQLLSAGRPAACDVQICARTNSKCVRAVQDLNFQGPLIHKRARPLTGTLHGPLCARVHTALRMRGKNRHKKKKKNNSGRAKACAAWAVAPALAWGCIRVFDKAKRRQQQCGVKETPSVRWFNKELQPTQLYSYEGILYTDRALMPPKQAPLQRYKNKQNRYEPPLGGLQNGLQEHVQEKMFWKSNQIDLT